MEAYDVLVIAMSSLIMLILIHVGVFGVIRWMYPSTPQPQVRFAEPIAEARVPPQQSFTEPPQMKQEVNVPTFTPPVPVEAPGEEGGANTGKAPSAATERPSWLVAVDPKTLDQ
jgi:predicted lipid-binding transport protein (Tim44 family)